MPTNLHSYLGSGYLKINPGLLGQVKGNSKTTQDLLESCALIDRELENCPPARAGLIVYRKAGPLTGYSLEVGKHFVSKCYLSTSQKKEYLKKGIRGELVMTIECCVYSAGRDIARVRANNSESEILFHRKAKFIIKSIKEKGGVTFVDMLEVAGEAGYVWGAHEVVL